MLVYHKVQPTYTSHMKPSCYMLLQRRLETRTPATFQWPSSDIPKFRTFHVRSICHWLPTFASNMDSINKFLAYMEVSMGVPPFHHLFLDWDFPWQPSSETLGVPPIFRAGNHQPVTISPIARPQINWRSICLLNGNIWGIFFEMFSLLGICWAVQHGCWNVWGYVLDPSIVEQIAQCQIIAPKFNLTQEGK